jgi:hypothetical protein
VFTDRPGSASGWEVRPLASPPRLTSGHDVNRYHKVFPHRVLTARYSVYQDGNIRYRGDVGALVDRLRETGAALGLFRHPEGRTLAEEPEACRRFRKFDAWDAARAAAQLDGYAAEGLDLQQAIGTNYLLVRDHAHPGLALASSLWWSQLFEHTKRDQLSLPYVLWKTGLPWVFLDDGPEIDPGQVERVGHRRSLVRRATDRVRRLMASYRSA